MLNIFNLFKKKEEKVVFPRKFAVIRYTKHSKDKSIHDDENKVIEIYEKGDLIEPPQPYTKELVNALEEVDGIPVIEEKFDEEEYEFKETGGFGFTQYRR